MRKAIKGKHIGNVETYDIKSGRKLNTKNSAWLMPAAKGTCEQCATKHDVLQPHNAQSMFYKYYFYNQHNRWPDWRDAMSHCSDLIKDHWRKELTRLGVNIDAGHIVPSEQSQADNGGRGE